MHHGLAIAEHDPESMRPGVGQSRGVLHRLMVQIPRRFFGLVRFVGWLKAEAALTCFHRSLSRDLSMVCIRSGGNLACIETAMQPSRNVDVKDGLLQWSNNPIHRNRNREVESARV